MDPVAAAFQIQFNYSWLLRVLGWACGVDVWPDTGLVHCGCLGHGRYVAPLLSSFFPALQQTLGQGGAVSKDSLSA